MVVVEFNIIRIKYGFDAKKSSQINAPKVFVVKCKRSRWFICRIKQYANFVIIIFLDRKFTGIMNIHLKFSRATVQLISFGWNEARVNEDIIIIQTLAQVSSFFNF